MKESLAILFIVPWWIRLYVYYNFEERKFTARQHAANLKSLKSYYPGNLTVYLSPTHGIFIATYVVLGIDFFIFVFLSATKGRYNNIVKAVIRTCFNDMRNTNLKKTIGKVVVVVLIPCTKFGIFGLCLGFLQFPFGIGYVILFILRLLAHVIVFVFPKLNYKLDFCSKCFDEILKRANQTPTMDILDDTDNTLWPSERWNTFNTCPKRLLQLFITLICITSFSSVLLIVFELVSFGVDLFVFTLIGLILNASKLMSYLSFLFLLIIYVNDCFVSVRKKFLSFNETLNDFVFKLKEKESLNCLHVRKDNRAFQVDLNYDNTETMNNKIKLEKSNRGYPRWNVQHLFCSSTVKMNQ